MSAIDSVWENMKMEEVVNIGEYKSRLAAKDKEEDSIQALIKKKDKLERSVAAKSHELSPTAKKTAKKKDKKVEKISAVDASPRHDDVVSLSKKSSVDVVSVVSRLMDALNDEDKKSRRTTLVKVHALLFEENVLSPPEYSVLFRDNCKRIFKLLSDPDEKCREMSTLIALKFSSKATDFVSVLGYLMPCVMERLPQGLAYDEEMKVFVTDMDTHEAYRRGRAVDRQDRTGTLGASTHIIVESSEEIRCVLAKLVFTLIKRSFELGAAMILTPYFHEIILCLQYHLADPYPELKVVACNALQFLCQIAEYESGMKFFAVGLVRAILPVLRHRHAKVRLAAVSALRHCMCVPDRAKLKGSGTEALPDLVGFREENVLQVAAFYRVEVQINYLAELVGDNSVLVREEVAKMLTMFLTELGDRYDHQTRLLPYLLDLLIDEAEPVRTISMNCLKICGQQYEDEHQGEIIERRQYGVDGDTRINVDKALPAPFSERPRLGVRLYIRGNTKRFLNALVSELTNWQAQTRLKSVSLLKIVVCACEEHLTVEAHTLLPSFVTALNYAKNDGDKALQTALFELFELFGRYLLPETYVHFIIPRLRGDRDVVQFGIDAQTRESVLQLLKCLIVGSRYLQVLPHFESVVETVCDPFIIDPDSSKLQLSTLALLNELMIGSRGKGMALVESHFMNTGRLGSLQKTVHKLLRFFLVLLREKGLNKMVSSCVQALAELSCDITDGRSVERLFIAHGGRLLTESVDSYDASEMWNDHYSEKKVLTAMLHCPWLSGILDRRLFGRLLQLLVETAESMISSADVQLDNLMLISSEANRLISFAVPQLNLAAVLPEYSELCGERSAVLAVSTKDGLFDEVIAADTNKCLLARFVDVYIRQNIWSLNCKLIASRMNIFHTLCGPETDSVPVSPMFSTLTMRDRTVPTQCLRIVVSSAIQPANPVAVRVHGLRILLQVFESLNVSAADGVVRLKSFVAHRADCANSDPDRTTDFRRFFTGDPVGVQECIRLGIHALDDSNDTVRCLAIEFISAATLARLVEDENPVCPEVSYPCIVSKLLIESPSVMDSNELFPAFEQCLFNLAALAPVEFEGILRSLLSTVLRTIELKQRDHENSLSDFASRLVNHCQLLMQLRS
jgi:hypothetical protein